KVIAGALQGFSAAGRVQPGPGYTARAAAAGTGQGLQYAQQQDTRERAQANEDYERQQQQLVRKAQGVMLRQTFATQILQYKRLKFALDQEATQANEHFDNLIASQKWTDKGIVRTAQDIYDRAKTDPEIHQALADNRIAIAPYYSKDRQL